MRANKCGIRSSLRQAQGLGRNGECRRYPQMTYSTLLRFAPRRGYLQRGRGVKDEGSHSTSSRLRCATPCQAGSDEEDEGGSFGQSFETARDVNLRVGCVSFETARGRIRNSLRPGGWVYSELHKGDYSDHGQEPNSALGRFAWNTSMRRVELSVETRQGNSHLGFRI
jgi:hypothetical protein